MKRLEKNKLLYAFSQNIINCLMYLEDIIHN
jgi:hypothetical protein